MINQVKEEAVESSELLIDVENPSVETDLLKEHQLFKNEEEQSEKYDLCCVKKNIKLLHQRNVDVPRDSHVFEAQNKVEVLYDQQQNLITQIIGLYCQNKYDKDKFMEAREAYLMNCVGISPQLFIRDYKSSYDQLSEFKQRASKYFMTANHQSNVSRSLDELVMSSEDSSNLEKVEPVLSLIMFMLYN